MLAIGESHEFRDPILHGDVTCHGSSDEMQFRLSCERSINWGY